MSGDGIYMSFLFGTGDFGIFFYSQNGTTHKDVYEIPHGIVTTYSEKPRKKLKWIFKCLSFNETMSFQETTDLNPTSREDIIVRILTSVRDILEGDQQVETLDFSFREIGVFDQPLIKEGWTESILKQTFEAGIYKVTHLLCTSPWLHSPKVKWFMEKINYDCLEVMGQEVLTLTEKMMQCSALVVGKVDDFEKLKSFTGKVLINMFHLHTDFIVEQLEKWFKNEPTVKQFVIVRGHLSPKDIKSIEKLSGTIPDDENAKIDFKLQRKDGKQCHVKSKESVSLLQVEEVNPMMENYFFKYWAREAVQ